MARQRKKKGDAVSGWVNLDKPLDLGSTDAVSRVKRLYNAQKAGHAGTLDPLASGVLPIALGEATKTVPFLMEAEKSYRFTIAWGAATASFDREGEIIASSDARPTVDQVEAALPAFRGEILQTPPTFSAVKVDGQRAYDLAREGVAFELEARPIVVRRLQVTEAPRRRPRHPGDGLRQGLLRARHRARPGRRALGAWARFRAQAHPRGRLHRGRCDAAGKSFHDRV